MKKGEITSTQIITVVLLILGFILIFFVMSLIKFKPATDKEACHQSVVYRSSFNLGPLEASKNIPLKCSSENICISASGKRCEQYPDIKDFSVTKIDAPKDKRKIEVLFKETLAQSLYDCNSMLGEGQLDFLPHKFSKSNYCLTCARIVLDKEAIRILTESGEDSGLGFGELYQYLAEQKAIDGKSYLEGIYPGMTDPKQAKQIFELSKTMENSPYAGIDYSDYKVKYGFEPGYTIISGMISAGTSDKWFQTGIIALGGTAVVLGILAIPFSGPVGIALSAVGVKTVLVGTAVGATAIYGGYTYIYEHPNGKSQWIAPQIYPYDIPTLKSLKCNSFEIAE